MAEISLVSGELVRVTDRHLDILGRFRWYLLDCGNVKYARAVTGDRQHILMHRLILNPPRDKVVDHINGDGLDNRDENLRVVEHAVNLWNRHNGLDQDGVSFNTKRNKWRVHIGHFGQRVDGGFYDDEATALLARDYLSSRLRGTTPPFGFDYLTLAPTARRFLFAHDGRLA